MPRLGLFLCFSGKLGLFLFFLPGPGAVSLFYFFAPHPALTPARSPGTERLIKCNYVTPPVATLCVTGTAPARIPLRRRRHQPRHRLHRRLTLGARLASGALWPRGQSALRPQGPPAAKSVLSTRSRAQRDTADVRLRVDPCEHVCKDGLVLSICRHCLHADPVSFRL